MPMPDIPAIPNPGITNISTINKTAPTKTINKSVMVANLAMYDAPKDKAKHTAPNVHGIPQPGLCNSNNIPRNPNVVKSEATIGLVKNRTKFSDQFSLAERISA